MPATHRRHARLLFVRLRPHFAPVAHDTASPPARPSRRPALVPKNGEAHAGRAPRHRDTELYERAAESAGCGVPRTRRDGVEGVCRLRRRNSTPTRSSARGAATLPLVRRHGRGEMYATRASTRSRESTTREMHMPGAGRRRADTAGRRAQQGRIQPGAMRPMNANGAAAWSVSVPCPGPHGGGGAQHCQPPAASEARPSTAACTGAPKGRSAVPQPTRAAAAWCALIGGKRPAPHPAKRGMNGSS